MPVQAWTELDRERIALFKAGWSSVLIAEYRDEPLIDVIRSVNLLLDVLGEKLIEVE